MTYSPEQAKKCEERTGLTDCPTVTVRCECEGCGGKLGYQNHNVNNSLAFLSCDTCGCAFVLEHA